MNCRWSSLLLIRSKNINLLILLILWKERFRVNEEITLVRLLGSVKELIIFIKVGLVLLVELGIITFITFEHCLNWLIDLCDWLIDGSPPRNCSKSIHLELRNSLFRSIYWIHHILIDLSINHNMCPILLVKWLLIDSLIILGIWMTSKNT